MSLLKYIDRLKRMDNLIRRRATGCADDFARKLQVSPSQLFQDLKEMKELGAPIKFCPMNRTYFYLKEGEFKVDFVLKRSEIRGGKNFMDSCEIDGFEIPLDQFDQRFSQGYF